MNNNSTDRSIHPLSILLLAVMFLLSAFFKLKMLKLTILYFVLLPYLFQGRTELRGLKENFNKVLYITFAVFMLVVLKLFYAHDSAALMGEYALRLFFLFSVSMFSFAAIDFDKIFTYLMASGKLKVTWGYSLLLAMNSLQLLKREQERISFNAKLRGLKRHQRYLVFFPILVFAIRHSERGAMALVTRGLNPEKVFYHVVYPEKRDRVTLISYFLLALTFFLVG